MKLPLLVLGVLSLLVGLVWLLQGTNHIQGSFT